MKFSDMISQLAGLNGLTAQVEAAISSVTHEYYLQDCSDAAFLDQISLRTGCEWFVDDTKLVVRKRPDAEATHTVEYGKELVRFSARYSGVAHNAKNEAAGWDP
jgi:phage protein D